MKIIKLSNEQARELFKSNPEFRDTILSDFSDKELEVDNRPKSWKELVVDGYYIDDWSEITGYDEGSSEGSDKNLVPTEANAKSVLALTQLLQLAKSLNGGSNDEWVDWDDDYQRKYHVKYMHTIEKLEPAWFVTWNSNIVLFKTREDASFSAKHHKQLWLDYYGVVK